MARGRAKKTSSDTPQTTSDVSAPKIRRTNAVTHEIPSLPKISGNLLVCGQNDVGQLGLNPDDVMEKSRPAVVAAVQNSVDVKAGGMHSLCLSKRGEIWSFGCNDEGALGRNTEEEGSETVPKKIELPGKVVRISAGDSHSACLLEDGRVFAWGSFRDAHGSMGLTTEGNKKTPIEVVPGLVGVDIASGNDHLVILAQNGHVYTIGCAEQGQLGRVTSRTLTGESRRGKTSLLTPGKISKKAGNFVANAIWATPFCTFLRENSSNVIYGFGLNNYNQLGFQKKGKEYEHFPIVSSFKDVKSITGGQHHSIVLTNDDKVYAIGRKDYGRLGLGNVDADIEELTLITALENEQIVNITCGDSSSFALTKDGKVYVWGLGTNNQLGTGEEEDVDTPKLLTGAQVKDKKVFSISSGGQHSLFIIEVPATEDKTEQKPIGDSTVETLPAKGGVKRKNKSATPVIDEPAIADPEVATDLNGNSEKTTAPVEPPKQRGKKRKA